MDSPNEPLKIAVVGFGKLGLLHAGVINGLATSRLSAVVDPSAAMLGLLSQQFSGVAIHKSHDRLLANGTPDAAVIAAPTDQHVPIALDFVHARVPILIEKPLATSAQAAEPLVDALRTRPVINMVGYMTRCVQSFAKATTILDSGALGPLQTFRATMYIGQLFRRGKGWRYDKQKSGGGVLITQNAHLIDQLLWLFGPLTWVSGHIQRLYSETVEDSAHGYFRFETGLCGYLDSSWSARHHRKIIMSIFIQGERGTLEVDDDMVRLFLDEPQDDLAAGWTEWRAPDLFAPVSFDVGGPHYTRQAETFVNAVLGRGQIESDVMSAYHAQCAIEAFYLSAERNGAPVSPAEVARS